MSHFYDTIARYYTIEHQLFTDDIPFYLDLANQRGDPILEVGCGTGRVVLPLAQAGYKVIGVDTSEAMLAIARRHLENLEHLKEQVHLIQGDILQHQGRYQLILLSYNALMHFTTQEAQLAILRHLAGLLLEDGLMVIDLPNAGEAYASEDELGIVLERTFEEPESGHQVMQQSVSRIDRSEQRLHVTWIYDEIFPDGSLKRTLAPLVMRYIFPGEMHLMLGLCGLEADEWYGDYQQNPFEDGCSRMILVAKLAGKT
jgi:SAM-dependent methyltransferase